MYILNPWFFHHFLMEFQLEHSVQDGALQLPMQPPDLARLTSAAPGAPGAPGAPVLGRGLSAEKRDAVLDMDETFGYQLPSWGLAW